MRSYLSASLPGVSATIRKTIYDASNWEDLHFLVKPGKWPGTGDEQTTSLRARMVIGLLTIVAPWLIVRRFGGGND